MTKRLNKQDARIIKTKPSKIPERILEMLSYFCNHPETEWNKYATTMLSCVRMFEADVTDGAFCEITGWTDHKLRRFESRKSCGNIRLRDLVTYFNAIGLSVSIEFKNDNSQKGWNHDNP